MRRAVERLVLAAILLAATTARAGDLPAPMSTPALSGIWTAMNSSRQVFRGAWTAEVAVATPNVALGTWTLTNEQAQILMGGSWSARKVPHGWRGAWSARVGSSNQIFSGTWDADESTLKGAKTFRDMLARTADKQLAGIWHMGRAHGTWWLKGPS